MSETISTTPDLSDATSGEGVDPKRQGLAAASLTVALLAGATGGLATGIWHVLSADVDPLVKSPLAALETASPYVVLVVALAFAVDRMLLASATVAVTAEELAQSEAYSMLRAVVPGASAAATAGYLTVVVGSETPVLIVLGVTVLIALGAVVVYLASRLSDQDLSAHLPPRRWWVTTAYLVSAAVYVGALAVAIFA